MLTENMAQIDIPGGDLPSVANQEQFYLCLKSEDSSHFVHQGTDTSLKIEVETLPLPIWVMIIFLCILLCLSGLFSGMYVQEEVVYMFHIQHYNWLAIKQAHISVHLLQAADKPLAGLELRYYLPAVILDVICSKFLGENGQFNLVIIPVFLFVFWEMSSEVHH